MSLHPENAQSLFPDGECLRSWKRKRRAQYLQSIVLRYLRLVYSSAWRRTASSEQAAEATRAVFLVLARRARHLRKKTILPEWLSGVTAIACRKLGAGRARWRFFGRRTQNPRVTTGDSLAQRVAPEFDWALDRLPHSQRVAVLLKYFVSDDFTTAAEILKRRPDRLQKCLRKGVTKTAKLLAKRSIPVQPAELEAILQNDFSVCEPPEGLAAQIFAAIDETLDRKPSLKLARQTLWTLALSRWRRRFIIGVPSAVAAFAVLGGTFWYIDSLSGHSRLFSAFFFWSVQRQARTVPGLAQPARSWPAEMALLARATNVQSAAEFYRTTNIYSAHLRFSREQWKKLEPKQIGVMPNFIQSNGTILLRNPKAQRSGLAGVLGLDFEWEHAAFDIGGAAFTNAGARYKGNGTYVTSLWGQKRPFKVRLDKFEKTQQLGGMVEFNFHNLVDDFSCLSDALAYEFFRAAGVPAPRTAYAYLSVSVPEKYNQHPLGLYLMVEAVDSRFMAERVGSRKAPLFKPVTYNLFEDLGDDWSDYAEIYDLKTTASTEQLQRVIEFAALVSKASDAEFARRVGDFLDLDEFARFLAGEVLLSCYDGLLSDGQNFYVYLDPKSNKFGFIPWDLDLAWGGFFLLGSTAERERASIWHPWVGQNRFLERVLAVPEFRSLYRTNLEDYLQNLFIPKRLSARVDELAKVIRGPIAAESDYRLARFEESISEKPVSHPAKRPEGEHPVHQLKRFFKHRAVSVRRQLDEKSDGVILHRAERR